MNLGAFSISLSVNDIEASRVFYEKLGFVPIGGDVAQRWLILRNVGDVTIGLFQGIFRGNMLTFNPGWDAQAKDVDPFVDVREIQRQLDVRGVSLATRVDPSTKGPGSLSLSDPDGNVILIDQHR